MWHIPFKGRNSSGTFNCNFLWQKENIYIMDNHRLALWCWLRHIEPQKKYELLHIDQHYDCLQSCHASWVQTMPANPEQLSLNDYINYPWTTQLGDLSYLFRFDNYLSLFIDKYQNQIASLYTATHKDGDDPQIKFTEINLPESFGYIHARCNGMNQWKSIINIDLDYFTETGYETPFIVVSDEYIERFCEVLNQGLESGHILCVTFALSPEFTGSWQLAEELIAKFSSNLNLGFKLAKGSPIIGSGQTQNTLP